MEDYDKRMFDPEKMRKEQLSDFLLSAAGRSTPGMTLGAAGKGASTRQRQQELMQREAMGQRQAKQEGFLETGRKSREDAFKSGDTALKEAQSGVNTGLGALVNIDRIQKDLANAGLDRESRERVAKMQANVQHEANVAAKDGTLMFKYQTLLDKNTDNMNSEISKLRKDSKEGYLLKNLAGFAATGTLTKDQQNQQKAAETSLEAQEAKLRLTFKAREDDIMSIVENIGGKSGLGSLPTGTPKNKSGVKVTEVK
jgi:hypothetical protein